MSGLAPWHKQDPCIIFFVTDNQDLASGNKSQKGGPYDSSYTNQHEAEGIKTHEIIHIEFILVNDGGAFANNTAWLTALLAGTLAQATVYQGGLLLVFSKGQDFRSRDGGLY